MKLSVPILQKNRNFLVYIGFRIYRINFAVRRYPIYQSSIEELTIIQYQNPAQEAHPNVPAPSKTIRGRAKGPGRDNKRAPGKILKNYGLKNVIFSLFGLP